MDKRIEKIKEYYTSIHENRVEIANNKALIAVNKTQAWEDASGIKLAKEKEDFVKSKIADLNKDIDLCEASIEYAYNMVSVLTYQMELSDE